MFVLPLALLAALILVGSFWVCFHMLSKAFGPLPKKDPCA